MVTEGEVKGFDHCSWSREDRGGVDGDGAVGMEGDGGIKREAGGTGSGPGCEGCVAVVFELE